MRWLLLALALLGCTACNTVVRLHYDVDLEVLRGRAATAPEKPKPPCVACTET